MKKIVSFALAGLLVACSTKETPPNSSTSTPTSEPESKEPPQAVPTKPSPQGEAGLPPSDLTFAILMPHRPYGSTNHDVRPRFNLLVNSTPTPERCEAIAVRAFFINTAGVVVKSQVIPASAKEGYGKYIEISPVEDLNPDNRYWLRVEAPGDKTFVLRNMGGSSASESEFVYDFFVGSAPKILAFQVSDKPDASVSLQFSEPVALKSISEHLEIISNSKKVTVCIPNGQGCNPAESLNGLMNTAQLQIKDAYNAHLTIRLLPGFMGSGRTVGETAQFSPELNKNGALEYDIAWTTVPDGKEWVVSSPPAPQAVSK